DGEDVQAIAARLVRADESGEHGGVVAPEHRRLDRLARPEMDVVELARGGAPRVAERREVVDAGLAGGGADVGGAAVVLPLERLLAYDQGLAGVVVREHCRSVRERGGFEAGLDVPEQGRRQR